MTSPNGNILALLASCEGNSSYKGQWRRVWCFLWSAAEQTVKQLSKQSKRLWFETPSRSLWRPLNDYNNCASNGHKATRPTFGLLQYHFMANDQDSLSIRDCINSLFLLQNHHVYYTYIYKWKRSLQAVLYWNPILSIIFAIDMSYSIFYLQIQIAIDMQRLVKDE